MNVRPASASVPRRALAIIWAAGLGTNLLLLALPVYSLQVFDRVLASRSVETLALLSVGVLIALAAMAGIDALRSRLLVRIGNRYALDLEPRLMDAAMARALPGGAPSSAPFADLAAMRSFLTSPHALIALLDAPLAAVFVVVIYLINPVLGHATLAGALALLCLAAAAEYLTCTPQAQATDAGHRAQGRIEAMLRNAECVEAMGMRGPLLAAWQEEHHRSLALASRAGDASAVLLSAAKLLRLVLGASTTGLGAWLAIRGELTTGAMIAATILSVRACAPLELLIGAWRQLVKARSALRRMDALLAAQAARPAPMTLPAPRGDLSVESVSYVPPAAAAPVLRAVTLKVAAGTVLGVVGPSGAGKTTLLRLLCGVLVPGSGTVRLDGGDVRSWERGALGRYLGYLPQDVELFEGTVRQNIARFDDADDAAVIDAARRAGVHEMILRLPDGYHTAVGPGGGALSGGQRQRIGLARALLGKPALVVLDEPNAALDAEGEAALVQALTALKARGTTVVVASHRPLIIGCADLVAVLSAGRLERIGPAAEVLRALVRPAAKVRLVQEGASAAG